MVSFYNYPKQQWQHLGPRIQWNPRSPDFGCEPMRPSASNAQAMIWKMLLVAEKRFRRLKARAYERCLSGSQVCEWSPGQRGVEGESRLSLFTHLLT